MQLVIDDADTHLTWRHNEILQKSSATFSTSN